MSEVSLCGLAKRFGQSSAVEDLSLHVREGEFVTLLGPSGCGKSTVLRMVAGLEKPDAGSVLIGGDDVTHLPARMRGVGMVFQSYALFPNMTAFENISFGLCMAKVAPDEIRRRASEALEAVDLQAHAKKYPAQLSGGMQQRVALARALVRRPSVLLLDEPLSALDARIRVQLRDLIKALQQRTGATTLYVTHDQEEAMSLSDRVAVMQQGRVVQVGSPAEIYRQPASMFVARFIGTLNLLPIDLMGGRAVRPEAVLLYRPDEAPPAAPDELWLTGDILRITLLGALMRVRIGVGSAELIADILNRPSEAERWHEGDSVRLCIPEQATFPIPERSQQR